MKNGSFIVHKALVANEERVLKLEKKILKSQKWARFMKSVDIGVKHPRPPKLRGIEIGTFPHIEASNMAELATLSEGAILIDREFYRCMGPKFLEKLLTHELLHCYLYDNKVRGWMDKDDTFEECAKALRCQLEVTISLQWRLLGQKKWREG
jgi:hypothetical protein